MKTLYLAIAGAGFGSLISFLHHYHPIDYYALAGFALAIAGYVGLGIYRDWKKNV